MKQNRQRDKILWGLLALSVIILAALLVLQLSNVTPDRETDVPEETSQEESRTEESQEETAQEQTVIEEQTVTEESESAEDEDQDRPGYIIIGDSHAVVTDGMGYSVYGSAVEGISLNRNLFIVHTGLDPVMGTIEWLEGDGTDRIKEIIAEHTELTQWSIICIHGTSMVATPNITERYISHYQKWIDETFYGCQVYIVSVPPLDEKEWTIRHPDWPARTNQEVARFNAAIQEAFPDQYFDYFDWFLERSDAFQDEIHYTGETYCAMFDEILEKIQPE